MKKGILIGLAMAMTATMALGGRVETISDGNWTNAAIWEAPLLAGDTARISHDVTLDSDSLLMSKVVVGRTTPGVLTIASGGNLTVENSVTLADAADGTLVFNGGQMSVTAGGVILGTAATSGTLTLNSGSVDALTLDIGIENTAASTMNLFGGTFTVNADAGLGIKNGGSVLNIKNDAQLILSGNSLDAIDGFASAKIVWADGSGMEGIGDRTWSNGSGSYLHAEFDGADTTVWTNTTIPEPATLGMLLMGSAGMLWIRRRIIR